MGRLFVTNQGKFGIPLGVFFLSVHGLRSILLLPPHEEISSPLVFCPPMRDFAIFSSDRSGLVHTLDVPTSGRSVRLIRSRKQSAAA